MAGLRLAAAVMLATTVTVAEALLLGVVVPVDRLDRNWRDVLGLEDGSFVLDEELALAVVAAGPVVSRG